MSWSGGAVNLYNMKAIPSTGERIPAIGLGNGRQILPPGPHTGGMLCAMPVIVDFKVDIKWRRRRS